MAVYQEGATANPNLGRPIEPSRIQGGKEYIFHYKAPAIAFSLISPETLTGVIKGWFTLKETAARIEPGSGEPLLKITGVYINTTSGDIYVRARTAVTPPQTITIQGKQVPVQINQAAINPLAIMAIIGGLFGLIGVGISLIAVYELTTGGPSPTAPGGILDRIRAFARQAGAFATGLGIGALLLLVLIVVLIGRSPKA